MHTSPITIAMLCGIAPTALAAFEGFAPRVDIPLPAGYSATDSVLVDLDNDADLDVALTCFTPMTLDYVVIYRNNGDGTFAPPISARVGNSPSSIATGDFNLDGVIDLVVANRDTDDLSLLLGNGDGTFQPEIVRAVGDRPQGIAVADFDRNGTLDAVTVNEFDDSVTIWFGDGAGSFLSTAAYTTNNQEGNLGNGPRDVTAVDLNFDGAPDIITANTSSGHATILYNIAAAPGSFFSGEFGAFIPTGNGPIAVISDDLGNDGDPDLTFCRTDGTVINRFNEYSGNPVAFPLFPTSNSVAVGGRPVGAALADFDDLEADGDRDLVIADEVNDHIVILENNGNAVFTTIGTWTTPASPQEPKAGDLDGDGDDDIVVPCFSGQTLSIFLNTNTVIGGPTPIVRIDEPGDYGGFGGCVCGPATTVTGVATIPAGGIFDRYTLDYRRSNENTWTTIQESTTQLPEPGGDLAFWSFPSEPEGIYVLRLTATSASGLSASDEAVVWISQNYNTVDFHFAAGYDGDAAAVAGRTVCIYGFVNDDACGSNTYTVDYRPTSGGAWLPVNPAMPVYTGDRLNTEIARWDTVSLGVPDGNYAVRVIAENGCDQAKSQIRPITVDNTAPVAEITGPTTCTWIDPSPTLVVKGTAFDDNLTSWTLEFTGGPFDTWMPITTGTSSVVDDLLAVWDTANLPPCAYTLRLRVHDASNINCSASTLRADDLVTLNLGCRADLAEPYGVLDLADIAVFVESFTAGCP